MSCFRELYTWQWVVVVVVQLLCASVRCQPATTPVPTSTPSPTTNRPGLPDECTQPSAIEYSWSASEWNACEKDSQERTVVCLMLTSTSPKQVPDACCAHYISTKPDEIRKCNSGTGPIIYIVIGSVIGVLICVVLCISLHNGKLKRLRDSRRRNLKRSSMSILEASEGFQRSPVGYPVGNVDLGVVSSGKYGYAELESETGSVSSVGSEPHLQPIPIGSGRDGLGVINAASLGDSFVTDVRNGAYTVNDGTSSDLSIHNDSDPSTTSPRAVPTVGPRSWFAAKWTRRAPAKVGGPGQLQEPLNRPSSNSVSSTGSAGYRPRQSSFARLDEDEMDLEDRPLSPTEPVEVSARSSSFSSHYGGNSAPPSALKRGSTSDSDKPKTVTFAQHPLLLDDEDDHPPDDRYSEPAEQKEVSPPGHELR